MQFELRLEEFKEIIHEYFKDKGIGEAYTDDVLKDTEYRDGGYYDPGITVGKVKISGHIGTMGKYVSFSKTLKSEEVQEIFSELLAKDGFNLQSISYQFDAKGSDITRVIISASRDLEKVNKNKR